MYTYKSLTDLPADSNRMLAFSEKKQLRYKKQKRQKLHFISVQAH